LCIGRPGVLKSPAMEEALRLLKILAAAARQEFNLATAEHDIKLATAKARSRNAEKEAAKLLAKNKAADVAHLLEPETIEKPTLRRYIATNASVEALGVLLQQNPNGLLVYRDEMLSLLDRLDEEGHADERGFFLTGWNGNSGYTFDRIGRGLDLHVEAVCISMLGGTQPGRISQYLVHVRRGGRGDDGLIQRFGLMVWPDLPASWTNVDRKPDCGARDTASQVFEKLDALDWQASLRVDDDRIHRRCARHRFKGEDRPSEGAVRVT
jgi:putative DNA primase/helicase